MAFLRNQIYKIILNVPKVMKVQKSSAIFSLHFLCLRLAHKPYELQINTLDHCNISLFFSRRSEIFVARILVVNLPTTPSAVGDNIKNLEIYQ